MSTALQGAKLSVANNLRKARDRLTRVRSSGLFTTEESRDIADIAIWIDKLLGRIITNEPIKPEE